MPCHSLQNDREKASPQCGSKNAVSALISLKNSAKCYCHPTHVISDFISNLSVRSFFQHLIVMGELVSYMYTLHTLTKLKLHSKHNHKNTDDGGRRA
jgi:hypothetical protein